jgi:lycopene beta-cyclase
MSTFKACHMQGKLAKSARQKRSNRAQSVHVIGDGCAGLSLAAQADALPNHQIMILRPENAPVSLDHIWGFWQVKGLETAAGLAHCKWSNWCIKTSEGSVVMTSESHCYHALRRSKWETYCRQQAKNSGVIFADQNTVKPDPTAQILDSRPPQIPKGQMIQHFVGWEIHAATGSFDPTTVILMDFRCDQSHGIHFIYLLPFSSSSALVESTMFAQHREPDVFFESAIREYLLVELGIDDFQIINTEAGAIPLGRLPPNKKGTTGIGSNGGAIRPSSGYAFTFIQKQIAATIDLAKSAGNKHGSPLVVKRPHKTFDLWMDEVFVTVLRHWPSVATGLFLRMARALSGDEFALFLSGEANSKLRAKVVLSMPKWVFLKAVVLLILGQFGFVPNYSRHKAPSGHA